MFDISYLFQFKKDFDINLLCTMSKKSVLDDFKTIWLRFNQIVEFWNRHTDIMPGQLSYLHECKKYIITFGFAFFNNLNTAAVEPTYDCSWIVAVFDYVYHNLSDRLKNKLITITEHSLLKNNDFNSNLIFAFITHPVFLNRYFATLTGTGTTSTSSTHYELSTLITRMVCPKDGFLEGKHPNVLEIQRKSLNDSTDLFLYLYNQEPEKIIDFFTMFVRANQIKTQVQQQTYYNDNINTYNFLMNMMVIINRMIGSLYDLDGNYEPIHLIGKPRSETDRIPNKIKLFWLVFEFYRITFYSLLLQNNNAAVQSALNPDLAFTYKIYIDANNKYLRNKIYFETMMDYMYDLIASDAFELLDEESLMEILYFWENVIETNQTMSMVCKKIVFRSVCNLFMNKPISNPHLSIKLIKILYLLEKFYHINPSDLLFNKFDQFNDNLCNFYVQIDKSAGLDEFSEKFYYKTNILELISKNELPIQNKHFVITIFKDVKNTLEYLIQFSNGHEKLLTNAYTVFKKSIENFLIRLNLRINFINVLIVEQNGMFNDTDMKYQLMKYCYGILKNCYDERSHQIKVSRTNRTQTEIWHMFLEQIIIPFSKGLNELFQLDQMVEMIHRFYGDLLIYLKKMDVDLFTEFTVIFDIKLHSLNSVEYPDDLPEEFLDPLLFTPIKKPVILPGSRIIMDIAVIEAHLLENETDPFNRQTLTKDQLDEFNQLEENQKLCLDFIQKRDEWIKTN